MRHEPALLGEVLDLLRPATGGTYVDATVGGGGHAEAILRRSSPHGRLIGVDRDERSLDVARERLWGFGNRVVLVHANFAELDDALDALGIALVDGIVADFGLASMQIDDPGRGFSFATDGPLDMRFDRSRGPTAHELLNTLDEPELADLLYRLGEERRSRAIARRIVSRRPIETTGQLRRAVHSVLGPARRGGIDPATRTFQALRMAVNSELPAIEAFLRVAPERLRENGRLVAVSYHSLEDRMVKWAFRKLAKSEAGARYRILTPKPLRPSRDERTTHRRARSAKLRALERSSNQA